MISTPIQTRWMDMDPFAHVSNSVLFLILRSEEWIIANVVLT